MSHLKERKEKDCLNCGAEVQGRYCQVCGQENIEPKESFWHLVTHFMYDVTHFDGKFFSTLKYLLFKPGFLSHEYLRGRRASYLHPIRMYVFTSAFFFLIFFSFKKEDNVVNVNTGTNKTTLAKRLNKLAKTRQKNLEFINDTDIPEMAKAKFRQLVTNIDSDMALLKRDSTATDKLHTFKDDDYDGFTMLGNPKHKFKTVAQYDSAQAKTPGKDKDGFFERRFIRQNIHLYEKYNGNSKEAMQAIIEKFKHFFPQMLFCSLPLFALMLQMLYARRRKFFYVNHVVYTIHLYCGTFIILLATMGTEGLLSLFRLDMPSWLKTIFILLNFFYWYKSMRNFYEQRRGKTILKYMIIMFVSLLIMTLIFTLFFIFSAMSI